MPSLKDLKNRIASVKATQKITKAMQMVAASKLRRAQTAAEAARPYAEKMDAVISNIASAAAGSPGAPALLAGTFAQAGDDGFAWRPTRCSSSVSSPASASRFDSFDPFWTSQIVAPMNRENCRNSDCQFSITAPQYSGELT